MKYQPEIIPRGYSITRDEAEKMNLLVHLGLNHVSFCIIDGITQEVKMISDLPTGISAEVSLNELIEKNPILSYHYAAIKVSFDTFQFAFLPQGVFNKTDLRLYESYVRKNETDTVGINRIPTAGIVNVYAMESQFLQAIVRQLGNPKVFTQVSTFLNGARRISQANTLNNVFIEVKPGVVEIGIIKEEGLVYYNLFEYANSEEFNYYVLRVVNEFGLHSKNSSVTLSGYIQENDALFEVVRKYFGQIVFAPTELVFNIPSGFRNIPTHKYYALLSLQLCD